MVALTHHEKWDGTGYPKGLKGKEIPLVGRIVAIADVFDALTSKRPYKEPFSLESLIKLLKKAAARTLTLMWWMPFSPLKTSYWQEKGSTRMRTKAFYFSWLVKEPKHVS